MLSEFQQRKIDKCFGHLDLSGDGYIDPSDSPMLAEAFIAEFGAADRPSHKAAVYDAFHAYTGELTRHCDFDGDGRISPDEFRTAFERAVIGRDGGFEQFLGPVVTAVFALCDADGDGTIDRQEFLAVQKMMGTEDLDADLAFKKLDADGDGKLTKQEFYAAAENYYTSDDPTHPEPGCTA
ncbi:EF-hand domain-containing protein, partial [Streptomyces sp. NPDC006283]|uniref:EF-hand domain-containing protein n=1 Tax=Streptomyces sp. NPDC006283 TaxID=3156741 RepID=UPI0033A5AD03